MGTHNICFCGEIRNILCGYTLLPGAVIMYVYTDHYYGCTGPIQSDYSAGCGLRAIYNCCLVMRSLHKKTEMIKFILFCFVYSSTEYDH